MLDSKFSQLVAELDSENSLSPASKPSEVTLSMWYSIADTRDPSTLEDLWKYTISTARKYRSETSCSVNSIMVVASQAFGMAKKLAGDVPDSAEFPNMSWVIDRLRGQAITWETLQAAIEQLSEKWQEVEDSE